MDTPTPNWVLLPFTATNTDSIMFCHYVVALNLFQKEEDTRAHDLIEVAFDEIVLDSFYEYARTQHWTTTSIETATHELFRKRRERLWQLVRQGFELACGRHEYPLSVAAEILVRVSYQYADEILVASIIAGKEVQPRLLPKPKRR